MRASLLVLMTFVSACTLTRVNWRNVDARADQMTLRTLSTGDVIGFIEPEGTVAWLGIPYAEPPVGPLRWKAPVPAKKRDVFVYSATKYGPQCPQTGADGGVDGDEACLTLNISARSLSEEKQPVMVWLHGGENTSGTANEYGVMRNLSRRYGVVVVGVNYRLGVLGWFHHPALLSALDSPDDASGNYGTLDQIAALEWVRDNIAKFGGDPGNVTVFGAEAGGSDLFALLSSPRAQGLFHRAAIESGAPSGHTCAEALDFTDDGGVANSANEVMLQQLLLDHRAGDREGAKALLATLRESDVANYLRSRTPEQLLAPLHVGPVPPLLRDGRVVLETVAASVQVLLGSNHDEYQLVLHDPRFVGLHLDEQFDHALRERSDAWRAQAIDAPAATLRRAGVPTFVYRFDWDESPRVEFGDARPTAGQEVGFVLGDEACELVTLRGCSEANEAGRVKLSRAMMSYWVQFARTGTPGRGVDGDLPEWKGEGTMIFDTAAHGGVRLER